MGRYVRVFRDLCVVGAITAAAAFSPAQAQTVNYSYTYWNAAEPGWGFNVLHQGNFLYGTWYTYADDGQAMFLTVESTPQADGSFAGPVYRIAGTPFEQINGMQAFTAATEVGQANMVFDGAGNLTLNYTIGGVTQTKQLERFTFDPAAPVCVGTTESRATASNYSDLWWNDTEAGWGLTISHQGDVIFVLWYTYGEGGRDQWISASTLIKQPDGSFTGALQRPNSGTPLAQIAGAATTFPVPEIGTATLTFSDGENGSFRYIIGGVDQTKAIKRFVAVGADQPKPICMVESGGGGTGGADSCYPDHYTVGDRRAYRHLDQAGTVTGTEVGVVIGPATYSGQQATQLDFTQNNGDVNRTYQKIENGEYVFIGEQALQNGAIVQAGTFNPFPRTPINLNNGQVVAQNYAGTSTAAGMTTNIQYQDTLTMIRRESVTVPGGTFENACFMKRELRVTAAGFTTTINSDIWARGDVGEIKSISSTAIGGPFPVQTQVSKELTSFTVTR